MCLVQTLLVLILAINCARINSQLAEGIDCRSTSGKSGICLSLHKCPAAVAAIHTSNKPQICGFERKTPIVCCEDIVSRSASIAARKCAEYKTKSIPTTTTTTTTTTTAKPPNATDDIPAKEIIGGVDAFPLEFPHMAILGYGPANDIKWICGGSLISEYFVLTAAHCIYSKYGRVSTINLGAHNLDRATGSVQTFAVKSIFQHPEYSRSQNYHDIALIELDRPANIQAGVKPACLHTAKTLPSNSFTATGWGATELYGGITQTLQKVDLKFVPTDTCAGYYRNQKRLANGLIDEWQFCGDGGNQRADTCQGDSGGPLHLPLNEDMLYTVAGITSFGIKCALVPAVYTRVSYYVPWIEGIVWSN